MLTSMTGFAASQGQFETYRWVAELRSVNGRGLDVRLRVPEWIEGLEAALRQSLTQALTRGTVTLSLKIQRDSASASPVNPQALRMALGAVQSAEAQAAQMGLALRRSSAAEILTLRGVMDGAGPAVDNGAELDLGPLREHLRAACAALLARFDDMRAQEGAALAEVLGGQLDQVAVLVGQAHDLALARKDDMADTLRANLAKVMDTTDGVDPARVAQELAILVLKTDVTEEIDRLNAHIDAARALLGQSGAVGRKLDFLMQEFNRETNTICSKSQSTALTNLGLELKVLIDQMREQVQNVE